MKVTVASAAAAGAALAHAASYGPASLSTTAVPTSTYYEYYDDCTTVSSGQANVTGTVVSTHCSHCTESASVGTVPTYTGPLTTYTTAYKEFCSEGPEPFTEKTYTVTEPCTNPGAPHPSNYVPSAFTVTTATCHVCASTPVIGTITTPNPNPTGYAATGAGAPPPYSPAGTRSPSAPGTPGSVGTPGSAGSPGAGSPGASSPSSPGAGSPASYGSPGTPNGAGSEAPSGTESAGSYGCSSGNCSSSGITPFKGAASTLSASHVLFIITPLVISTLALVL